MFPDFFPMRKFLTVSGLAAALGVLALALRSQTIPARLAPPDVSAEVLNTRFQGVVRPFIQTYCVSCHGADKPEAAFNLESFTSMDLVVKDYRRWNTLLGKLQRGAMPPEDAAQHPTPEQVKHIIAWIQDMQTYETTHNAGDPGIVLARRLSNAEYDYTIRDLTGVDIQPTKEFPVDPANEAGFDNTGESLAMSPELVKKYLDAAQLVADHIVFRPNGFTFAPYTMVTDEDRDKYAIGRVVDFYKQQGLTLTGTSGTYRWQALDYADYFLAAWRFQNRAALGKPAATLDDFAKDAKISPKYLGKVWTALTAPAGKVGPMAAVQARFRSLPSPEAGKEPEGMTTYCGYIRDIIIGLRPLVKPEFDNLPSPRGPGGSIASGSQIYVLWKDQQYAQSRMTYAGNAQTLDMSGYAQTDPALLIPEAAADKAAYEDSFKQFCAVFPDAFVIWERARMFLTNANDIRTDLQGHRLLTAGFHSQMGYFRDDQPLYDLVLDAAQQKELDNRWKELDFVAQAPLRQFKQFMWFERAEPPSVMMNPDFNGFRPEDEDITTETRIKQLGEVYQAHAQAINANDMVLGVIKDYFATMNAHIRALEAAQKAAEPSHLDSLVAFAESAFRRPLSKTEREDILAFYRTLRSQQIGHEDAIRYSVVSVLMSPSFCFRVNSPDSGQSVAKGIQPLSDYELASRLSYFLWSSMPDKELLDHAKAADLHQPAVLAAETKRMLADERVRGLAAEFGGNWLDIRRFEEHNAVDRDHFPTFTNDLREAMFQEPIRFFVDVAQHDSSILDFIYGDYTFVNPVLAKHYGMPEPKGGADQWMRVDDAQKYQRGGILPMAAFLTKNAPGLRTSPVKRGFWVVSKLLGEYIPAPPPNVPAIPSDESKLGELTLRQTLAQHHANPACASCHEKFDSFGLVFEGFGPIGEARTLDLGNRPVETNATFPDGTEENGVAGLRSYLKTRVQDEFVDNLSRKLVSYALGRTLVPSDEPLVGDIDHKLAAGGYRFDILVNSVINSKQFLTKRTSPGS